MHISPTALLLIAFSCAGVVCSAQAPQAGTASQPAANKAGGPGAPTASAAPALPAPPSALLKSALDGVRSAVGAVNLDRWKKGTVREEAGRNIGAIQHDLVETLPPLLKEADASPGMLSKVLPVSVNVNALYDVLVHVAEAARVSAPGEQVDQLAHAMDTLEKARVALGNRMLEQAASQEKQLGNMRTAYQAQSASMQVMQAALGVPACPAPPAPKKPLRQRKTTSPATKPATGAKPAAPQASSTQKPSAATPSKPQ